MHDLRELLAEPARVAELTTEEAATALVELATLQAALAARLRVPATGATSETRPAAEDRLLTAAEVAEHLRSSVAWVYRHARHWPFTRKLSHKVLRFSEVGLREYLATRRRRG